jgi:hypothetical protein
VTSAIDRIAFYSKGIPRIINMICDNALLIASATDQTKVGAEIIEEVADELKLKDPSLFEARSVVTETPGFNVPEDFAGDPILTVGRGARTEDHQVIDGANYSSSMARGYATVHKAKRWKTRVAAGVIVVIILIGAAPFISWQKSGVELPPVTVPIEEVFTPIRKLIDRVLTIQEAMQINSNVERIVESPGSDEEPWWNREIRKRFDPLATKRKEPPRTLQEDVSRNRTDAKLKPVDRTASSKPDQRTLSRVQNEEEKTPPWSRRSIRVVVENSIVRDEPTANAEIIATLRPGAQIRLLGRKGDYWQIRSSEPQIIRGYVHREDAFFAPSK